MSNTVAQQIINLCPYPVNTSFAQIDRNSVILETTGKSATDAGDGDGIRDENRDENGRSVPIRMTISSLV